VEVGFSVAKKNVGVYSVYLNGLKGSFTVISKPIVEPTKATEPEPDLNRDRQRYYSTSTNPDPDPGS
jgi:hypothetical protein